MTDAVERCVRRTSWEPRDERSTTVRYIKALLAAMLIGTPWLIGCSDNDHHHSSSSRSYDPNYGVSRSYDYDRYDRATEAGYGRGPWRGEDGNPHPPPGGEGGSAPGPVPNDPRGPNNPYGPDLC